MATPVRTRRFLPVVETLNLRLAPTALCPMTTTVLYPALSTTTVTTSPMQTTLITTSTSSTTTSST